MPPTAGDPDPSNRTPGRGQPNVSTAARQLATALARALWRSLVWLARRIRGEVVEFVGGPARARVIALFAAVLGLSGADAATVGAVAPQLEHALHIGNAKVGLLSSVALLVGALFVIPVGLLVDRTRRMPLLAISILLWSIASLASAFSGSYSDLLLSRLALGAVTATAGPAIASLTGDYFPARERGRVYAYILGGETIGTAAGFILSGTVASLITWRAAFVLLAIPGFFLARTLWRTVPEPLRGGQSHLEPGAVAFTSPASANRTAQPDEPSEPAPSPNEAVRVAAERRGAQPNQQLVLTEDPQSIGIVRAVRYVLSVPTMVFLIIGSSLGYFFFSGLQTFGLLFVRSHYQVDQATAELGLGLLIGGALVGTILSGQLVDLLLRHGHLQARIWIPACCYAGAAVLLLVGILNDHFTSALWFDVAGAALLAGATPALSAARLDIMPAGLWGRSESTNTFLRSIAQALAPLAFGGLADLVAGIVPRQSPIGTHLGVVSANEATGLQVSFLIMLSALAAAAVFLARARHTYPTDIATAAASDERISEHARSAGEVTVRA